MALEAPVVLNRYTWNAPFFIGNANPMKLPSVDRVPFARTVNTSASIVPDAVFSTRHVAVKLSEPFGAFTRTGIVAPASQLSSLRRYKLHEFSDREHSKPKIAPVSLTVYASEISPPAL